MNRKLLLQLTVGSIAAAALAFALGGCAKKNDYPRMAKGEMLRSESHPALDTTGQAPQYSYVYSDSIVSTISPLFSSSPSNGCAWVQVAAGPPTSFTMQSLRSAFSAAYPQGQVRLMYATAPMSSGGAPYDTSWQLAPNISTPFPQSFRDVFVAQYQTTSGGPWTPFDCVTVMDTAYNPMPSLGPSITTPGEYYFNYKTKDDTTAAATCVVSIP